MSKVSQGQVPIPIAMTSCDAASDAARRGETRRDVPRRDTRRAAQPGATRSDSARRAVLTQSC
eukprot:5741112-Lingulodinium_polyedra.AAC.1